MKPPMPYFGGKQTLAPWIVDLLPAHAHYVEPFGGSLSVLMAKPPSAIETVNDLNRELMTFWRVLRDQPRELARACTLTPHSLAELEAAFEAADDDIEIARRVWVRLTQARSNGLEARRTGWRRIIGPNNGVSMPGYIAAYLDRLAPAAERLARVSLECLPALDLIAKYGTEPTAVLYIDPPYLASTRNSTHYGHELKTEAEHRELAAALAGCRAAVVLSGYHSPLYDELYDGWHVYEQATATGNGKGDKARIEVLWANRSLGDQLDLFSEQPAV
jgi:DNA adenine methylase